MSQPPQPPDQPAPGSAGGTPQGGFGAPQDPSYGYPPQQPPGPPAYGYPQAPPPSRPPQAPPPPRYGYPGAPQPSPGDQQQYGQQPYGQQAYGQQQYGMYPPPGQFPGGMPPQGGGNQSQRRMLVVVSAVVAVLLVVGGGIWFATSGDDKDGKPGAANSGGTGEGSGNGGSTGGTDAKPGSVDAELLTKLPLPKVTDIAVAEGLWVTDKVFAKGGVDKIVGYDPTGADKKWEIPLAGSICWASRHVSEDGRTAVLFQGAKATKEKSFHGCTEVGAIDLDEGRMLWRHSVAEQGDKVRFDEVTVGGGTVAAGGIRGGAAWKLDGGKELWKPKGDGRCRDLGYGGGRKLVAVRDCGDIGKPEMESRTLNPATGEPTSVFKVPGGIKTVSVASTDPLVIGLDAGDDTGAGVSDFMAIDDSGKSGTLRGKIATQQGQYAPDCNTDVEGCRMLAVSEDTLYLPTKEHKAQAEYRNTNEIFAFDLDGGKAKGKADAGEGQTMIPLRMDKSGKVIAYRKPTWDRGGAVVSIDPTSYKQTELLRNPNGSARAESELAPQYNDIVYAGGRLYLGDQNVSTPTRYTKDKYFALVFGSR
ncbi:hypothetical protein ABZW18_04785 [Streptomyces sp. NPDC004647]|uniref:hypothetical protein n=1 Tax=Streptomyces sp. NPDC004647 TaxID=3154671 RepID=UPI0033AECB16